MDQVKTSGRNLSLRKSLVLYIVVFVILDIVLSGATSFLCDNIAGAIRSSYPISGERYYLTNEQGERLGDGAYISELPVVLTEQDERTISLLGFIPAIATPLYSALCIIVAALLFYRNKIRKPLAELMAASEKISNNDLNFSIGYDSRDELGQLCTSFEIMRAALAKNFSEMWRQVEERRQINAAFAHDLRTPLTVLKGYTEMLRASDEPKTSEIAVTMEKHLLRMESYVSSMSHLRRLEDTQPEYRTVPLQAFIASLYESAEILCRQAGKRLDLQNNAPVSHVLVDTDFVSQVSNNLISNAVRYARSTVRLFFALEGNAFLLSAADDGKGFRKDILHRAASPYFTEEKDRSEHFGLGLYICKLLCERHGGYLRIENTSSGAKVTACFHFPQ